MEISVTFLTLVENYIVGVLLGASTLAVISYAVSLRYGYPKEGVGHALIQSIYTLIRLFHIFFAILVALYIIFFGILDGIPEVWYEYGIKASVLFFNAIVAVGMARRKFPVSYFAPVIATGWYFLASYHSYSLHIVATDIVGPLLWFVSLLVFFQVVFILLRRLVHPIGEHELSDEEGDTSAGAGNT